MKKYIIYTESNQQFETIAKELREAIKNGRRICKLENEVFHHAKLRR